MGCTASRASGTPLATSPPDSPAAWAARALLAHGAAPPTAPLPPPAHATPAPDGVLDTDTLHVDTVAGVTFVNQYVVAGGLGRGAHGAVRAAVDTRSGALVALKVAPRWGRADKAALLAGGRRGRASRCGDGPGAAAREAALLRALAAASVPGVVRLLELVDDPRRDRLLLVLDFAERGAVGRAAAPRALPAARVWRVAAGAAAALAGMHAAGVAHGDVKPDNVLERGDGGVVLADLGSARPAAAPTCCGGSTPATPPSGLLSHPSSLAHLAAAPGAAAGGTPAFAPPEACGATPRDAAAATAAAADTWALGVTLHALAYGVLPFSGAPLDLCEAIVSGAPALPADAGARPGSVDPASPLGALIAAALAKDPADRPSAADLAARAAEGVAAAAAAAPRKPPAWASGSGHRARYAPGARVATQSTPARHALAVVAGTLDIVCERAAAEGAGDDDAAGDEEFDGGASDDDARRARAAAAAAAEAADRPTTSGRMPRPSSLALLGRSHTVSETVAGATSRAAALVERARVSSTTATVVATRGPGALVGEPALLGGDEADDAADAGPPRWRTSIIAGPRGATLTRVPRTALAAAAAADADAADALDAALAARRAELLVASALERLAALAARIGEGAEGLDDACDAAIAAETGGDE